MIILMEHDTVGQTCECLFLGLTINILILDGDFSGSLDWQEQSREGQTSLLKLGLTGGADNLWIEEGIPHSFPPDHEQTKVQSNLIGCQTNTVFVGHRFQQ